MNVYCTSWPNPGLSLSGNTKTGGTAPLPWLRKLRRALRLRSPATLAAARILLAGFATLTAACSRPEISREGTRGSAREPVVMTKVVETEDFSLPLPRGYEDATTELKKDLRELVVGTSAR